MITIILPTYNSITFLEDRVSSIINQSYKNWECLVIDGESTDGTWEYLEDIAKNDNRFKLNTYPAKGVYDAWNKGVALANGQYVYFATSDDTMTNNCLQELLKGFDLAPNCTIAHCCLKIIDEDSKVIENFDWKTFPAQDFFKNYTNQYHIRKAPLIGILYATHQTIIHSFTQVLISRKVFKTCGHFLENKGAIADLEWGMRVGLTEDIVHVPLELATWRIHKNQLTKSSTDFKYSYKLIELMFLAISNANCSKDIKENKNLLLAWNLKNLFLNVPFLEKIKYSYYWNFVFLKWFKKGLKSAFQTRKDYHFFLLKRLGVSGEKSIELL
jgi:glycosyltransferase involved in cell wall biosynthesis